MVSEGQIKKAPQETLRESRQPATLEDMLQHYSDEYKRVHGIRPRWIWEDWKDWTVEQVGEELEKLWGSEYSDDQLHYQREEEEWRQYLEKQGKEPYDPYDDMPQQSGMGRKLEAREKKPKESTSPVKISEAQIKQVINEALNEARSIDYDEFTKPKQKPTDLDADELDDTLQDLAYDIVGFIDNYDGDWDPREAHHNLKQLKGISDAHGLGPYNWDALHDAVEQVDVMIDMRFDPDEDMDEVTAELEHLGDRLEHEVDIIVQANRSAIATLESQPEQPEQSTSAWGIPKEKPQPKKKYYKSDGKTAYDRSSWGIPKEGKMKLSKLRQIIREELLRESAEELEAAQAALGAAQDAYRARRDELNREEHPDMPGIYTKRRHTMDDEESAELDQLRADVEARRNDVMRLHYKVHRPAQQSAEDIVYGRRPGNRKGSLGT